MENTNQEREAYESCGSVRRDFKESAFREYLAELFRLGHWQNVNEFHPFIAYIRDFRYHNYGTMIEGVVTAMMATFKHVSRGLTGYQAGCIAGEVARRIEGIRGPFKFLRYEFLLLPHNDDFFKKQIEPETQEWLIEEAKRMIKECNPENKDPTATKLRDHLQKIIDGSLPFGYSVMENPKTTKKKATTKKKVVAKKKKKVTKKKNVSV